MPVVTASLYGDHGTGSCGLVRDVQSIAGFAELSNNYRLGVRADFAALGKLDCGTKIDVTYRGRTITIPKVDVGAGGPGINGHVRAIDLTMPAARALNFPVSAGLVDVIWNPAGRGRGGLGSQSGALARPDLTAEGPNRVGSSTREITREMPYEFSRGTPDQRENSWECMGRLADEVQWRRYMRGGSLWYVSDRWLEQQPVAFRLNERSRGVISLKFDFETRRRAAEADLQVIGRRYSIMPGDLVELEREGPGDGKWLVSNVRRSLFSQAIDVKLVRPRPRLPEPAPEVETRTVQVGGDTVGGSLPMSAIRGPAGTRGAVTANNAAARIYGAARVATGRRWRYSQPMRNTLGPGQYADCSSGVSWVLNAAGIHIPQPMRPNAPVSGQYTSWGVPGPGRHVTIMCNAGHIWMRFTGFPMWRFDTGGGSGGKLWPTPRSIAGFVQRHWPGT